jgi:hypothetical protein
MIRAFVMAILALGLCGIGFGIISIKSATAAAPPPSPYQQRPDVFPCDGCRIADKDGNGVGDMQDLNPTTLKAKATRAIAYRVVLRPGCSAGAIPADLAAMNAHVQDVGLGLTLRRDDQIYDFSVNISCGLEQITKCGGVNVYCLPDGFPYDTDVYLSDVLSGWDSGSRLGIPLHEILGHAIGSWNEQYALCGASCGFASTPGLRDVMNTGPLSRHGIEQIELDRWERTMWPLTADNCIGATDPSWGGYWDNCRGLWIGPDGWDLNPVTGAWQDKDGVSEWCCQQPYGGYYNRRLEKWYWDRPTVWAWEPSNPVWRCVTSCP